MEQNNRKNEQNLDRTLGCMVGGAVGDALGYAVEFYSWPQIQKKYGSSGICEYELDRRGMAPISDDTQMSLFTASGILEGETRAYMRGLMARIDKYCLNCYQDWLNTQEMTSRPMDAYVFSWLMDIPELYACRAPGNTCLSALRDLKDGRQVDNDSCGCGGVMRTAPMALRNYIHSYAHGDFLFCDMCAAEAARITHKHPLGFLPSSLLNHILMEIMDSPATEGDRLACIVLESLNILPSIQSEDDEKKVYGDLWPKHVDTLQSIIKKALDIAFTDTTDVTAIESIGGGWTGHEALAIAIYSTVKHNDSFEDAIISSVNHSGDSDSTGAICGNIIGCLLGLKAIPSKFTDNLEMRDIIEEMAHDIWSGCNIYKLGKRDTPEKKRWFDKYCMHHWEPITE